MSDDEHVTHQSGASRFVNSLICAMCIAPVAVIGTMFLLGWNEKRAACMDKALHEAEQSAKKVGCDNINEQNGHLVMFACDIQRDSLTKFPSKGDFSTLSIEGTGLKTTVEMRQCVESSSSKTTKDKSGGGGTTTKTSYSYSVEWSSRYVDLSSPNDPFEFQQACGGIANPSWSNIGLPDAGTVYAKNAKAGVFTLPDYYVSMVPLAKSVEVPEKDLPKGWSSDGAAAFVTKKHMVDPNSPIDIGKVRVSFKTNNMESPTYTVLGQNNAGEISPWKSSDTWLCSGQSLSDLRVGELTKDMLFSAKKGEASAMTWFLRFLAFAIMWYACSRFAAPLGVIADCIPCIGPWLGDQIEAIACCVAFCPACALSMVVAGIVWIAMRPLWGGCMLALFCAIVAVGVAFKMQAKKPEEARDVDMPRGNSSVELTEA